MADGMTLGCMSLHPKGGVWPAATEQKAPIQALSWMLGRMNKTFKTCSLPATRFGNKPFMQAMCAIEVTRGFSNSSTRLGGGSQDLASHVQRRF